MPQGTGTYGSQKGRPAKKDKKRSPKKGSMPAENRKTTSTKKKGNFLKNLGKAIMQEPNERMSRAQRMAEKLKKKKQS